MIVCVCVGGGGVAKIEHYFLTVHLVLYALVRRYCITTKSCFLVRRSRVSVGLVISMPLVCAHRMPQDIYVMCFSLIVQISVIYCRGC